MERIYIRQALACLITAAACVVCAAPAVAAAPKGAPAVTPGSRYLALGDSVTFGYEEPQVLPAPNYKDQASFLGYPAHLAGEEHLIVTNASCPGETAASFVNASAQSNGCENSRGAGNTGYRTLYPLHVNYKGSQLAFALSYLHAHPKTTLVSLMIGANDFFLCEDSTKDACLNPTEQAPVIATIERNVRTILAAIRNRAHYRGQIVIVNYYSLNYALAPVNSVSELLNHAQDTAAQPFHVEIANGYGEFADQASKFGNDTCRAGLLTQWYAAGSTTPTCGVHPSYAGQALLAEAVLRAIHK